MLSLNSKNLFYIIDSFNTYKLPNVTLHILKLYYYIQKLIKELKHNSIVKVIRLGEFLTQYLTPTFYHSGTYPKLRGKFSLTDAVHHKYGPTIGNAYPDST